MNKKEEKIIAVSAIFLLLVLLLAIFLILGFQKNKKESSSSFSSSTQSVTESATAVTTNTAPRYIIGEWNGKLAVFTEPDTNTPSKVYNVYLTTLPAEEQSRLKTGIPVYTEQMLERLLEDYTS